ncbi:hypothetical protein HG535_0H00960 [Zygotorulaspora mrakii]|uniref:ATP-dependent RNA helicase n=1 Tax=Zygotorulaspora mrakii TaxID=42260 RepID=A0A7H9B8K5_ZYGMR|nr:uncharacterized protein HG535_0H00960 [Zygotorulaspora mrakii]QLG74770.1 hypothetical protein HG535_0H00960 [Zygotorulaspora mrakii]
MSDDDVMLVNFATDEGDASSNARQNVKVVGGKWKDRRRLKMMVDGEPSKRKRLENTPEIEREIKKVKEAGFSSQEFTRRPVPKKTSNDTSRTAASTANSNIVSSLFTSNREMTTSVNTNKHDENAQINPSNAPLLEDSFEAIGVKEPLVSHLAEKMRIKKPTNIQKQVISQFCSATEKDNDLFINAQTGSGKTLAFLLPILSRILDMNVRVDRKSGCFALIIAPTRELASQIYSVASMLTNSCHYLVPCLLIGGERKKSEKARLRKGCNFIIGTPGRILDHLQNTKVIKEQLGHSLRYVVLDEGDKLMELGFEETITEILQILHDVPVDNSSFHGLPSRIVHVLCSATLQGGVKKLGNVALTNYKLIKSGKNADNAVSEVPDQLLQKIVFVSPKLRLVTLAGILDGISKKSNPEETSRTIVFLTCSDSVDFHYDAFSSSNGNYRALAGDSVRQLTKGNTILPSFSDDEDPGVIFYKLHGSLPQPTRVATLDHFSKNNEFTKGKHLIMFCTDVASRGLDLPHVGTVVEMDPPFSTEDHLHRTGRTARAGQKGEAILFLFPGEEEGYLERIKPSHPKGWKLVKYDEEILKPAFDSTNVKRNDKESEKPLEKTLGWDTNATTWHLNIERRVLEDPNFKSLAMKAFTSHVRAYATHISQEKQFFNIKFLHLGHLAKGFALRERPKGIAFQSAKSKDDSQGRAKKPSSESGKNKMFRMARMAVKESVSEFNY